MLALGLDIKAFTVPWFLCIFVDIPFMFFIFLKWSLQFPLVYPFGDPMWIFSVNCYLRATLAAFAYLRWVAGHGAMRFGVLGILLGLAVCGASGYFSFRMYQTLAFLGHALPESGSPLARCLNEYAPTADCAANNVMLVARTRDIPRDPNGTYASYYTYDYTTR